MESSLEKTFYLERRKSQQSFYVRKSIIDPRPVLSSLDKASIFRKSSTKTYVKRPLIYFNDCKNYDIVGSKTQMIQLLTK